jgi:predicted nucleic acid-binding protein
VVAYLDSSAAVKLAHREDHSDALAAWLNSQQNLAMVSSALVEIELPRALHRYDSAALPEVPQVLARLVRIEIHATIRTMAGTYQHALLRSLDAIHLATARYVSLTIDATPQVFIAYDARLLDLARLEHFETASPGL